MNGIDWYSWKLREVVAVMFAAFWIGFLVGEIWEWVL